MNFLLFKDFTLLILGDKTQSLCHSACLQWLVLLHGNESGWPDPDCLDPAGSRSRSGAPLLSTKTDNLIAKFRATHLQRLNSNDIRQLWASVKPSLGKSREGGSLGEMYGDTFAELDNINEHFAGIATDPNYDPEKITAMKPIIFGTTFHYKDITCEYEVYIILAALKKTSPITREFHTGSSSTAPLNWHLWLHTLSTLLSRMARLHLAGSWLLLLLYQRRLYPLAFLI